MYHMVVSKREMVSVRMPAETVRALETAARRSGSSRSALIVNLVDEGLRRGRHPRITFKDGPSGRRAAIVGGPDVWELMGFVHDSGLRGDKALMGAAEWFSLPVEDVIAAIAYATEYADEIGELVRLNTEVASEAQASWEAQRDLIG